jgi:hypothetical protein
MTRFPSRTILGPYNGKAARALARAGARKAREAGIRAGERLTACEGDLSRYSHLDAEIAQWTAGRIYDDLPSDELPHPLTSALSERQRGTDRANAARLAQRRIEGEQQIADGELARCERWVREAAKADLAVEAVLQARERMGVHAHGQELDARLLAYCAVLGTAPHQVTAAMNAPRQDPQRDPKLEAELRSRLEALISDD